MKHKAILTLVAFLLVAIPASSFAGKNTIYKKKQTHIKLVKADKQLLSHGALSHPREIPEEKMFNILASLRFDKNALFFKDTKDRRVFTKKSLKILAPVFVQAFQKAGPKQQVYFRFVQKGALAKVVRNDRLIQGEAFIRGDEVFFRFAKIHAKIFGDYEGAARHGQALVNRSKDIRVSLAQMNGQRRLGTKFIALNILHDFKTDLEQIAIQEKIEKQSEKEEKSETVKGIPLPQVAKENSDAGQRLETLQTLRDKNLISEREYQAKKREILKEL
jgi:uncharacterized protein YxeA